MQFLLLEFAHKSQLFICVELELEYFLFDLEELDLELEELELEELEDDFLCLFFLCDLDL